MDLGAKAVFKEPASKNIVIAGGAWHQETFGGAYKVASELAEFLASKGHRVHYMAWTLEKSFVNPILQNGVSVWRYPAPKWGSPNPMNAIGHIRGSRRLVRQIRTTGPIDYLNGHDFLQFLGGLLGVWRSKVGVSFSVHSPLVQESLATWDKLSGNHAMASLGLKHKLAIPILEFIEERVYRNAHVIQTDSQFTLDEISRYFGPAVDGKGTVCHLWVDLDRFFPAKDRVSVRHKLGGQWECTTPLFFTLRRLVPRMGVDNLVRAVSILKKDGYECRLLVGGTGPDKEELEQLISDLGIQENVFLIGRIQDDVLPSCYQAADCFVLPTKHLECFGLIILEAYACGVPVIGTPVGSIPEVMGEIGRPFTTRDTTSDAIAKTLHSFIQGGLPWNPEDAVRYAQAYSLEERAGALSQVLFQRIGTKAT